MIPSILFTTNIVVKKEIKIKFRNQRYQYNLLQLTSWTSTLMKLITIERGRRRLRIYFMHTSISNYKRKLRLYQGRIRNYSKISQHSKKSMSKSRVKYWIINRKWKI